MKKSLFLLIAVLLLVTAVGCANAKPSVSTAQDQDSASVQTPEQSEDSAQTSEQNEDSVQQLQQENESPSASDQLFDALQLDMKQGTIYVRTGSSFSYVREDGKEADYEIIDHTLYIDHSQDHKTILTLPEGEAYTSLLLNAREGHVYIECSLSLQTLEMNVSRGEVTLSEIYVSDQSVIEVGQGSAFLTGDPGISVTACSREGHLSMDLAASKDDYNYEIELSTGNITLGNESYHGRALSKTIDNGAQRSMKLDCSRGDLSVQFHK